MQFANNEMKTLSHHFLKYLNNRVESLFCFTSFYNVLFRIALQYSSKTQKILNQKVPTEPKKTYQAREGILPGKELLYYSLLAAPCDSLIITKIAGTYYYY